MAYRLLLRRGEWDVDGFFSRIPAAKWEELKIAHEIIESRDAWLESLKWPYLNKKAWQPPEFKPRRKPKRRRLDGTEL